jgi:hypothetical protein
MGVGDRIVSSHERKEDSPAPSQDATMERLAELSPEEREVLLKVVEILRRLQFGTVLLVVQDGKVIQIEMAEKFRLR